jgi:hypothetical protein
MREFFIFLLFLFSLEGYTQTRVDSIDLSRITDRKVRNYLTHARNTDKNYLNDFKPSCNNESEISGYTVMKNSYLIKEKPENVWQIYKNTNMAKAWNGKMCSFCVLFSKWTNQVLYKDDLIETSIDTGQVFFIDLKIFNGLYNLPVGVQVMKIDSLLHSFTFSYLEGGKSKGFQTIQLLNSGDGFTQIVHTSAFKSNSRFRDKHIYPFFHTKILNEFHHNIVKEYLSSDDSFIISP